MKALNSDIKISQRNLPHWHRNGAIYWITFRLADSLPQSKLETFQAQKLEWLEAHPKPWDAQTIREYRERFPTRLEDWLDAGYGQCHLKDPAIRESVRDALLRFNGKRLKLHAAVIMPNHVHAILEPLLDHPLSKLLKGIKGSSARSANQQLNEQGAFWMDESYDRIVRNEKEYLHFKNYIHENPQKAGLASNHYWLFSE